MKLQSYASLFALALMAPVAAARSPAAHPEVKSAGTTLADSEVLALRARHDAGLDSLRAGRTEAPASIHAEDRTELRSAEARSVDLLELRAGYLTDREWTLILVGALILLVIILI